MPTAASFEIPRVGDFSLTPADFSYCTGAMVDTKAAVTEDVVYRIEVSLSSRKSSVVVLRTIAKLYSLHNNGGDAEWKMLAYGVPCILLQRLTTEHNSPFAVKVVIAELETGSVQWEGEVNHDSQYQAMQANFHAFAVNKQTFALQFVSPPEASRMLVSVRDYIRQKEETDIVNFNQSNQGKSKSKPKRKTSKKNISTPSNFKHVTSVTSQRRPNADELSGNFTRHLSFNAGDRSKPSQNGTASEQQTPSSPQGNPLYAEIGEHLLEEKGPSAPPHNSAAHQLQHHPGLPPQNHMGPLMRGSVRLPRRQEEQEGDDEIDEPLIERGSLRHSLPSHLKQRVRVPLSKVNFEGPHNNPLQSRPGLNPEQADVGLGHTPYPLAPGGQRLEQGPMLSSQPNLAASRESTASQQFTMQPPQWPPSALQPKPYPDYGYQGNLEPGHNSLPRPSSNNQFSSAYASNLRQLSAGSMSASMPSMERGGFAGAPLQVPSLAPLLEYGGAGVNGLPAPPPNLFNPSPHLRAGASHPGAASAPNPYAGPSPPFVPPPAFSHPHRTAPVASSASTTPTTPSTPSTPTPSPAVSASSNASKTAPPSAQPSPIYDVLPPLQQPSPRLDKVDSDIPPKQDFRARPQSSYAPWTAGIRNGATLGHDSLRSADLHATDV